MGERLDKEVKSNERLSIMLKGYGFDIPLRRIESDAWETVLYSYKLPMKKVKAREVLVGHFGTDQLFRRASSNIKLTIQQREWKWRAK